MDVHTPEANVRGLYRIAEDLHALFDRVIDPAGSPPSRPTAETTDRFLASVLAAPVLYAMVAEHVLKLIAFKRSGNYQATHDLQDLYNDVDSDAQRKIVGEAGRDYHTWDSVEAVALIDLEAEPCVTPRTSEPRQTLGASDTFTVTRHRLGPSDTLAVPPWSVGWVVDGVLRNDDVSFAPRSAWIASEAAELRADADCETLIAHER